MEQVQIYVAFNFLFLLIIPLCSHYLEELVTPEMHSSWQKHFNLGFKNECTFFIH